MKNAVIRGERDTGLVEVPDPEPKEDWALVKVQAIPMCTEYKACLAENRSEFLGHEAVGEIAAVARPCRVNVGDRVVALWGYPYVKCEQWRDLGSFISSLEGGATYAQYVLKPSWLLAPISEGVSYEHASLTLCALGPSFGAL